MVVAAVTEAVHDIYCAENDPVQLSAQELINCVHSSEDSTIISLKKAYNFIEMEGLTTESECPFNNEEEIKV